MESRRTDARTGSTCRHQPQREVGPTTITRHQLQILVQHRDIQGESSPTEGLFELNNTTKSQDEEEQECIQKELEKKQSPRAKTPATRIISSCISQVHVQHKAAKLKPLVEIEVKRSQRLRSQNNGYKAQACTGRNCIYYSSEAPTISKSVIKNLGEAFCKIDPKDLSEENLTQRSKRQTTIKKASSSKPNLSSNDNSVKKKKTNPKKKK